MIDYRVLNQCGSTQDRLREIFTSRAPAPELDLSEEARDKINRDIKVRERIETEIRNRTSEQMLFSLRNHRLYSAVDLACDGPPINKETYPLMLYAQGQLDVGSCGKALTELKCAEKFVTKDEKGNVTGINLPRFVDVSVNLVRSFITRRLAAQSNKYSALYPHYKYEPRGTKLEDRLRADVMSQLSDIISDAYGYKHHEVQVYRDTFKYAHSVDFIRCSWEKETQWAVDTQSPESGVMEPVPGAAPAPLPIKSVVVKEGVDFVNPHPSRVFWDNAYPLSSINTDTGGEFIGYWDVARLRSVRDNPKYWNRDQIFFSSDFIGLFETFALYFSQYYCYINPPKRDSYTWGDAAGGNDRSNNLALYASNEGDTAVIECNYFRKLVPADWGIGTYPFPVWVRFVTAGAGTVVYAEILPSLPAAYCGYNEDDNRQVNISVAHELMSYQDHLTNLLSYLLLCLRSERFKVLLIDIDMPGAENSIKDFRSQARGNAQYSETQVFEYSGAKMRDVGIDPKNFVQLVETRSGESLSVIFQAIAQLLSMVERLQAMSPQEQGQPAPREISATESNMLAGTTESVYSFISDSFDEYRGAKKKILYESYMSCGSEDLRVPVISRYSQKTIEKAGLKQDLDSLEQESASNLDPKNGPRYTTVIGSKSALLHDYIFTARDGSERPINTQAANVLVQMLNILLANQQLAQAIGKERLYEMLNEVFRMSGAGYDLKLELEEGESDSMGANKIQQIEQILQQITQLVGKNSQEIEALKQASSGPQQPSTPPPQPTPELVQ